MLDKEFQNQGQFIGDGSTAAQAGRDVIIINNQPSYSTIKEIFVDLLDQNFPKLLDDAMDIVNERTQGFLHSLKLKIEKMEESIHASNLKEPNFQYNFQKVIVEVARKGEKANPDILADMILKQLTTENIDDVSSGIIDEAIKIVPSLMKKHIHYLGLKTLLHEFRLNQPMSPDELDQLLDSYLDKLELASKITALDMSYLSSLRLTFGFIGGVGGFIASKIKKSNPYQLFSDIDVFKSMSIEEILSYCSAKGLGRITFLVQTDYSHIKEGMYDLTLIGRTVGSYHLNKENTLDHNE